MRLQNCKTLIFVFLFSLFFSKNGYCAGYGIYEWSTRGNALGGTLIGRADDPSAVAFNPAGIVQLNGTQIQTGITLIYPNSDVTTNNPYLPTTRQTAQGQNNIWAIPHFYLTQKLAPQWWLGIGVFSRAGLGVEYKNPKNFWGRYNNTYTGIKSASLNPNLAFKINDKFSIAAGMEAAWLDFTHEKTIDSGAVLKKAKENPLYAALTVPPDIFNPTNTQRDIYSKTFGNATGVGVNLALRFTPEDWITLGLTWRSKIQISINGKSKFDKTNAQNWLSGQGAMEQGVIRGLLKDCGTKGSAPIPEIFAFGITLYPIDNLSLEFDTLLTRWSAYKELSFVFDSSLPTITSRKDWKDAWRFQFGGEYALTPDFDLRASYVYDQSPINGNFADYIIPANNRHLFGFGIGFTRDNWTIDLGYTYLLVESRNVQPRPQEGVFKSRFDNGKSHLGSFSLNYHF